MTSLVLVLLAFQNDPTQRHAEVVKLLDAGRTFEAEAILTEIAKSEPQNLNLVLCVASSGLRADQEVG
jgi:hypothetical protein